MVVSERYACFWSLFNLRFSLYNAQFIMLTLSSSLLHSLSQLIWIFSLLFSLHLLYFVPFSVALFFSPDLPVEVKLFFCLACMGEWCCRQWLSAGEEGVGVLFFVVCKWIGNQRGFLGFRPSWVESQRLPLWGMAAIPETLLLTYSHADLCMWPACLVGKCYF